MSADIIMRVNTRHDTTVVIVGDTKVGKSALVNKFRTGKFESGYNKTSFESFNTSSIVCGQRVKFTIYDTSGWFCHLFNPKFLSQCSWCSIKSYYCAKIQSIYSSKYLVTIQYKLNELDLNNPICVAYLWPIRSRIPGLQHFQRVGLS